MTDQLLDDKRILKLRDYLLHSEYKEDLEVNIYQHEQYNVSVVLKNLDLLLPFIDFLRHDHQLRFDILSDICGVDYLGRKKRFEVVYHFLSLKYNFRLRLKVSIDEMASIGSITGIFRCADWYEREIFDMYGIVFNGHKDLRRILTDYGFVGYPLRKDFPLSGHVQVKYDLESQNVVQEEVRLTQEMRNFDFTTPWDGMHKRAISAMSYVDDVVSKLSDVDAK